MEKIKIRTVHEVISERDAKHILAVTQRVDTEPGYEDGAKVERPKLRTQEAIFQSRYQSDKTRYSAGLLIRWFFWLRCELSPSQVMA